MPDDRHKTLDEGKLSQSTYELLLKLRRALPEKGDVHEGHVLEFNAAISKLEGLGHDLSELKVSEGSLSRGVASWDSTPGGEAFEMDPSQHVEDSLFRSRLDRAIDSFEIVHEGADEGAVAFTGLKK